MSLKLLEFPPELRICQGNITRNEWGQVTMIEFRSLNDRERPAPYLFHFADERLVCVTDLYGKPCHPQWLSAPRLAPESTRVLV